MCQEFVKTFGAAFMACRDAGEREVFSHFEAGVDATFIKYAYLWKDMKKIEWVKSYCLSRGARIILDFSSDNSHAFMYAIIAYFLSRYVEKAVLDWSFLDLLNCFDFSLVHFFKNSLPCTCLDEAYGEPRREIVDEEELESVESTFEYDQFFFLHVLPPPKKRIYSPKATLI